MVSPEASENATHTKKKHNEEAEHQREQYGFKVSLTKPCNEGERSPHYKHAKERYGLRVSHIEDNLLHVQDAAGHEVAFEFPMGGVTLDHYDSFIEQMQDASRPLPDVENIVLTVAKPLADASLGTRAAATPNSATRPYSWEQAAKDNGMTVDEMWNMYFFAREELFVRFRSRLRN
jgi:hypothetical protein